MSPLEGTVASHANSQWRPGKRLLLCVRGQTHNLIGPHDFTHNVRRKIRLADVDTIRFEFAYDGLRVEFAE